MQQVDSPPPSANQKPATGGIGFAQPTIAQVNADAGQSLRVKAKAELLGLIQSLSAGSSLPTYHELADKLGCSIAPIKQAARELHQEGHLSLQRGRPAKVLWNNSFSRSAQSIGKSVTSRVVEMAYRPFSPLEQGIASDMGIAPDGECIVCVRIRLVDGRPAALQSAYINPVFFPEPQLFFLQHDVVTGSLSEVYASLGVRPLSNKAVLKAGLADERERKLLELPETAPVLRSRQRTTVDNKGRAEVLEIMIASYTQKIDYAVERLPRWSGLELEHG
ncbi:MAG: GntR family transcriptional regulator [Proteobacteria bacterium]|nr:GntR family transcriptional regulator [Pseudomonadota bacterium]